MSSVAIGDASRCAWCRSVMMTTVAVSSRRRFCGRKCRQSAFRLRRRSSLQEATASSGAFHYADPPYPGTSSKYYRDEPSFAGEVDFAALILSLTTSRDNGDCLGWALSTSARSLRTILPLCPPEARVCAWVKPIGVSGLTYGLHNTWEPLIVVSGRQLRPGKRDWLRAMPARGEGTLPGRKPLAFCAWLFELLGMRPGDTLVDLFPGTGIVSRAWDELSSTAGGGRRPSLRSASTTDASVQVLDDVPESATVAGRGERLSLLERGDGGVALASRRLSSGSAATSFTAAERPSSLQPDDATRTAAAGPPAPPHQE